MMRGLLVEWDVRSFHYALIPRIEGLIGDLRVSICKRMRHKSCIEGIFFSNF